MSRWRDAGVLAACLAVVAGLTLATGDRADSVPVRYDDVEVGEAGVATTFDATVLDVALAQTVRRDEYSEVDLTTDAAFVVVTVTADARTDTLLLSGNVALETADGRRYAPRDELTTAQPPTVEPGFSTTGTYVFEVPPDRVPGARLLIEPGVALFLTHDTTIRVDLALDASTAVAPSPLVPEPSSTEVTR